MQIAEILLSELLNCSGNRIRIRTAPQIEQFLVTREPADHVGPVGIEKTGEDVCFFLNCQVSSRFLCKYPVVIFRAIVDEIIQLFHQHRGDVDGYVHVGVVFQDGRHIVIIFGSVHAHPRAGVDPIRILVIQGLVLMPG